MRHKQVELEEARALQLAMLPRSLPEVPDLELAAHMDTATEVGGDYYDFDVAADGSLTVAVGDATGHGMKAGTLVTATKSLFKALGEGALLETLDRSSAALKAMNLRQLNMALLLARWQRGHLRIAAAGMPPVYLYRAAENQVEAVLLPGLPLGTPLRGRYQETQLTLECRRHRPLHERRLPRTHRAERRPTGLRQGAAGLRRIGRRTGPRHCPGVAAGVGGLGPGSAAG